MFLAFEGCPIGFERKLPGSILVAGPGFDIFPTIVPVVGEPLEGVAQVSLWGGGFFMKATLSFNFLPK